MLNDKSSKIWFCYFVNMLTVDFKEIARRENLERFLKSLFLGMNSSDEEFKFGLQGRTSCS